MTSVLSKKRSNSTAFETKITSNGDNTNKKIKIEQKKRICATCNGVIKSEIILGNDCYICIKYRKDNMKYGFTEGQIINLRQSTDPTRKGNNVIITKKCEKCLRITMNFGKHYDDPNSFYGRHCLDCLRTIKQEAKEIRTTMLSFGCGQCKNKDTRCLVLSYSDKTQMIRHPLTNKVIYASSFNLKNFLEQKNNLRALCRNCWRLKIQNEHGYGTNPNRVQKIVHMKKHEIGECKDCRIKVSDGNLSMFEFDHIDTLKKVKDIAAMSTSESIYPLTTVLEEMNKCELRCCNCHFIKSQLNGDFR